MLNTKAEPSRRRHDDVFHDILELDKIAISVRSHKLLKQLLTENLNLKKLCNALVMRPKHSKV